MVSLFLTRSSWSADVRAGFCSSVQDGVFLCPDLWVLVICLALRHNLQASCLAAGARFVRVPRGLLGPAGRYLQEPMVMRTLLCTPSPGRLGQSPFGMAFSKGTYPGRS